jgi:hypothetical protein
MSLWYSVANLLFAVECLIIDSHVFLQLVYSCINLILTYVLMVY